MRAIKTILIILAILVGVILLLGITGSDTYRYERSVTIAAPADVVYKHVSTFKGMDTWSPWNELDPNMKKTIEGTDGTVGAVSSWEGNEDVGKGKQELLELVPNEKVVTKLTFLEPWEDQSTAQVDLKAAGDSTSVTWSMSGENNFMSKLMGKFMNMEDMIGKDFSKGLGMLKTIVDEEQKAIADDIASRTFRGYTINSVERPAMVYVGKRKVVKWKDMKEFYGSTFGQAGAAAGALGLEMSGAPSAIFWKWDTEKQQADMMAAMPVQAAADLQVKGMQVLAVPAGKALHIAYMGGYSGLENAHFAMDDMMKAKGMDLRDVVIEEYLSDPMSQPDSTKWMTNIYYMVK